MGLVGDNIPPPSGYSPRSGVAVVGELVYPSDELDPDIDSLRCLGWCERGAEPLMLVGVFGPLGAGLPALLLCVEATEPSEGLGEGNCPSDSRLRCLDDEEVGIEGPRAGVDWAEGNRSITAEQNATGLADALN